jgi:hypothetical protein
MIHFDAERASRALDLLRGFVDADDEEMAVELELSSAWQSLIAGGAPVSSVVARAIERKAAQCSFALGVIRAAALAALSAIEAGDLPTGLEAARRAARMARTEAIVEGELLAGVTLARARRYTGRPHLGACILSSMQRFAPESWRTWLEWELGMCGDDAESRDETAALQRATLAAAARGDATGYQRARDRMLASCRAPLLASDATLVLGALELRTDESTLPQALVRWRCGDDDAFPSGIGALSSGALPRNGVPAGVALVVAEPGVAARRVLGLGAPLVSGNATFIEQQQRHQGRSDALLSLLLLAGDEGAEEADIFRRIYGFTYRPNVHKDVLKLLVHRSRARLGSAGTLHRADGRVSLVPGSRLLVVDPRCSRPIDERVLKLVATRGAVSAKDAAVELGVPLRTTQAALEALVAESACRQERSGRHVEYVVDDTTFEVPTRHRVR